MRTPMDPHEERLYDRKAASIFVTGYNQTLVNGLAVVSFVVSSYTCVVTLIQLDHLNGQLGSWAFHSDRGSS